MQNRHQNRYANSSLQALASSRVGQDILKTLLPDWPLAAVRKLVDQINASGDALAVDELLQDGHDDRYANGEQQDAAEFVSLLARGMLCGGLVDDRLCGRMSAND